MNSIKNTLNGAQALVRILEAHDVKHIFGLCGDTTLPFYDAMHTLDHDIKHVLTRDERSAAYMADGYSRVTGKPGVCEGPSGGGATLGITTDISVASYGKYPLTEVDQKAMMAPLTKWNTVITQADHIPRMVRQAFRSMTTGRSGSAHLGLPYDVQYQPVDRDEIWADKNLTHYPAYRVAPDANAVQAAVESILSAKKPIVVCGGGVVISGCLGVVGSNGGTDQTWELLSAADLVIFMGCRAGSTTTARWEAPKPSARVVHFDSDPMVIGANYKTEVGVVGDLQLALQAVNAELDRVGQATQTFGGAASIAVAKKTKFDLFSTHARSEQAPIRPERVIDSLMQVLPEDATIVSDPGTSCPYFSAYYQLPVAGRHFITNRAHGALGYSLSAALGAWFGRPQSKVVAMMGDGSFGFTCGELETVGRHKAPITFIVFSNSAYGWIKASQEADCEKRYYNVDFNRVDHAAVAAAYGVKSWRVDDPKALKKALQAAVNHDGPTLVDIVTQPLEEANAPVRRWMG